MRKSLRASVLLLALCCPAFAGVMTCPGVEPPPPQSTQEATTDGEMQNGLVQLILNLLTLP